MANLVPDLDEVNSFPTPLTDGERTLMNMLLDTFEEDDTWTVFVQPHMNGLNPDIVLFSPDAGIGIFEVKDWTLEKYSVIGTSSSHHWRVFDANNNIWKALPQSKCPFLQVERYRDSLLRYELPLLGAEATSNMKFFALVSTFVYFHKSTSEEIHDQIGFILSDYRTAIGYDDLHSGKLKSILTMRHLTRGSKFASWMKENNLYGRLRSALAYPEYGQIEAKYVSAVYGVKQKKILEIDHGGRRLLGVAGSGKTFILVQKAVHAAIEGKHVLIVCFNITMTNYLSDVINKLCRHFNVHSHRNVQVSNYHALVDWTVEDFGNGEMKAHTIRLNSETKIDLLLVDEGQDFQRDWIENLLTVCSSNYTFLFAEDDRQDIYAQIKKRQVIPGIQGSPFYLGKSLRVPMDIAKLANALMEFAEYKSETVPFEIDQSQPLLMTPNTWFNGNANGCKGRLMADLEEHWTNGCFGAPADTAILVSSIEVGRDLLDWLNDIGIPAIATFETNFEQQSINADDRIHNKERAITSLRRERKVAFRMQTGRVKVSTIHSFKGWELKKVFILFSPSVPEKEVAAALLYTALTRAMSEVHVYNSHGMFSGFGIDASNKGLIKIRFVQRSFDEWHSK